MPTGMEVALAVKGGQAALELCAKLGLELWSETDEEWRHTAGDIKASPRLKEINKALEAAHREALEAIGFKVQHRKNDNGYLVATGPCGKREFAPFCLQSFSDSEGETTFEDAPWGVALSGRYVPTFLDWRDEHGTLDYFVMDEESMKDVGVVRDAFRRNGLEALSDLPIAVCLRFY